MTKLHRPLPMVNEDSAPYWKSARDHHLKIQRCRACEEFRFYPSLACHSCGSLQADWVPIAGTGTVYSYTVVRRAGVGAFAARMPYTVALIALDEGPVMMSNIVTVDGADVDADDPAAGVAIGARVRVGYDDVDDGIALPVFLAEAL